MSSPVKEVVRADRPWLGHGEGMTHIPIYWGPWWCPCCSRAHDATLSTNDGEPCCPRCGTWLEEQGTGDDDPYPEDQS